jgi:hypothetical protein
MRNPAHSAGAFFLLLESSGGTGHLKVGLLAAESEIRRSAGAILLNSDF